MAEELEAGAEGPGPWRVEVVTARGECWAGNALEYDNLEEARAEARSLAMRWTLVKLARVVSTSRPRREACDYDNPGPFVVDYR